MKPSLILYFYGVLYVTSSVLEIYMSNRARLFPNASYGLEHDERFAHPCPRENTSILAYTPNRRLQQDTLYDARKALVQVGFVIALGGHSAGGGTGKAPRYIN